MKKIPLLIFFAFIIFSVCSIYIYVCKIKGFDIFVKEKIEKVKKKPKSKNSQNTSLNQDYKKDSTMNISIYFIGNNIKPENLSLIDSLINLSYFFHLNTQKTLYIKGFSNTAITENENYKLGRIRAWVIKRMLLDKGIKSEYLITSAQYKAENNIVEISSEKYKK